MKEAIEQIEKSLNDACVLGEGAHLISSDQDGNITAKKIEHWRMYPSPDTKYKIALTEWIEGKHQAENPYSVFEEWQKQVDRAEDGTISRSPWADMLEAEEGEG